MYLVLPLHVAQPLHTEHCWVHNTLAGAEAKASQHAEGARKMGVYKLTKVMTVEEVRTIDVKTFLKETE